MYDVSFKLAEVLVRLDSTIQGCPESSNEEVRHGRTWQAWHRQMV